MSQQINLFNPEFLKQKKIFTSSNMLLALGVLVAGALAMVMVGRHSTGRLEAEAAAGADQLALKKERQARVIAEFAPRQKSRELELEIARAEADLASLHDVSKVLGGQTLVVARKGYARYFKALARQGGGDLWLTGVRIGGDGHHIGLQGRALDASLVPAFVTRLAREPAMQGKNFSSLQMSRARLQLDGKDAPDPGQMAPYVDFTLQDVAPARVAGAPRAADVTPPDMKPVAASIKAEAAK
ncbi:PilN domain-containing protein [Massilia sp. CCM 8734]|uniref:PilN domain-containing protein n=1 Tax=Massilia sp. CCM 8734 TaxID=2609283 RepID=UPI001AAEA5DF|nr:PilN domain-containing protein [Massilia sp. CCM 8734]